MVKKAILFFNLLISINIFGEFREVTPLENNNFFIEKKEKREKENNYIKSESIKIKNHKGSFGKKVEEKKSEEITSKEEKNIGEVVHVQDSENVKEVIEKNSITIITEEQLTQIINHAKNSPLPENEIENKKDFLSLTSEKNSQPDFFVDIKKTLDKYNFSDKSEDIYGGQITSKELTSDRIIDNLEFGVGVAYKNSEYYNSQYENKNSDIWSHTPVYATGKYKISSDEESTKYLKLNLGYAIGEYEDNEEYMERRNQSGVYYGIGGGIEYDDVSLDLIYQVNKDAYEKNNSTQDDSRITFSVDYKLGF